MKSTRVSGSSKRTFNLTDETASARIKHNIVASERFPARDLSPAACGGSEHLKKAGEPAHGRTEHI